MTQRITRRSAEKSEQKECEFEYGEEFAHHFERLNPTVGKVFVR
jgi:hypothetical protein